MTIKEFAKLCECNPRTLRYYDSIDLLKPVDVDPWTDIDTMMSLRVKLT